MNKRTIQEIKDKIKTGKANVFTAQEIIDMVEEGREVKFEDVDVVTTATKGLMSGTTAIITVRVSEPGDFRKAKSLTLNGIPCYVGPCPNEYLGVVDAIIFGTNHSINDPTYGGGHLFRDLIENKTVKVKVNTIEDKEIETEVKIDDFSYIKMLATRNAFKNYLAFVNPTHESVKTIFAVTDLKGPLFEATFCGCGAINPIQNDPYLDVIGIGTPFLMNGAKGYVIGEGTRSTKEKANLTAIADMKNMKSEYTGGFLTSAGPEVINTWAVPIPIINEKILETVKKIDKEVQLSIVDVVGRKTIGETTYGAVWGKNYSIEYKENGCKDCPNINECKIEELCPTKAFTKNKGIDKSLCFNCGTCLVHCIVDGVFTGKMGRIKLGNKWIPVVLRQSDRVGANKLAGELKELILKGEFPITKATDRIY
ncbi:MAG: methanogenesis marker 16 metalloprotein [Candidatus Helarchaeota archaeon]